MKIKQHIYKLTILLNIFLCLTLSAQKNEPSQGEYHYKNTIGLRFGGTSGVSYKHIFDRGNAFEGIVSIWPYTVGVTALYEKHLPTSVTGLKWYFGGGGHFNVGGYGRTYYRYHRDYNTSYTYHTNSFATGVDGIIGFEYKFKGIPFALSTDIKPNAEMNNYGNIHTALDPSIGVKFTY